MSCLGGFIGLRQRRRSARAAVAPRAALAFVVMFEILGFGDFGLSGRAEARGERDRLAQGRRTTTEKAERADKAATAQSRELLLGTVEEITRQVAALRGLKQQGTFKRGVLSRDEIGQKLRERISKEYTPQEVRAEADVLKRMGLLPPDADYEKLLYDLLTEQVAGFYDPYSKTLYVADWLPMDMQRPAMAHEIEHALQDQHFDLQRFSKPLKDDGDRQFARSAVVEGDGTAVMLEFVARSMGLDLRQMPEMVNRLGKQMMQMSMGATPLFSQAPPVLRETLIFPYAAGLDFVESLRGKDPKDAWAGINEVFRHPPESTEQIMHPEKYRAHEAPLAITPAPLPSLAAAGFAEVRRDVLGEMLFKVWFAGAQSEATAEAAAAGWGGDRLVAFTRRDAPAGELPLVILHSVWDTEGDARDAERAAAKVLAALQEKSAKAAEPAEPRDGGVKAEPPLFVAERRDRQVLLLLGAPRALRRPLADEVFRLWKVADRPAKR